MLRLRLRGPSGGATINVPAGATAQSLEAQVRDALGLGAGALEFLGGHPPKPISLTPDGMPMISSGDTLVVRVMTQDDSSKRHCAEPDPAPAADRVGLIEREPAPVVTGGASAEEDEENEDAMLARAIALSQGGGVGGVGGVGGSGGSGGSGGVGGVGGSGGAGGGAGAGGDGDEQLVRRVVPADNSCLFVAVALALEGGEKGGEKDGVEGGERGRAAALREVVARAVLADPERFSEAVLGRPPEEYARWIRDPEHWGGGIELAVLAEHYRTELGAVDCQTQRVDLFGQGRGFSERVLLIYDGVHYDLLARTPFAGAPPEFDLRVFPCSDEAVMASVMAEAAALARRAQQAGKFTDTARFTLRCLVCQRGLTGQAEAVAHAKASGHTNFSEFK